MDSAIHPVRYRNGVPVYRYDPAPDAAPVTMLRVGHGHLPAVANRHIHDFPILLTDGESAWIVQPGEIIDPNRAGVAHDCTAIIFEPNLVDSNLLTLTRHNQSGGVLQISIPPESQSGWHRTIASIESEIAERRDGYRQALAAHLTVLLIELDRLAAELISRPDPTLHAVFEAIEASVGEPLTLSDVAKTVGLTPGYLTTWVRRRTGKTVQEWILERKLVEARKLLAETDLPVGTVARKVGFDDPAYFTRVFTREVGTPPRRWRTETTRA
ncbi:MAG: AraC family transcriptional regulator [Nocardiaceae bacterium]|nr:AraC family transcriptional regulator [Nocardiaceae bacterium]